MGERELHVLEDLARSGFDRLVLLGSDVPDLPREHLEQALAALAADPANVAIGPLDDGSYYLLGISAKGATVPDVFSQVRFGSPYALDDTRAAAARAGLHVVDLPIWHDVDAPEDLTALADRLRYAPDTAPHTAALLKKLGLVK
jgi:hypothetical protein